MPADPRLVASIQNLWALLLCGVMLLSRFCPLTGESPALPQREDLIRRQLMSPVKKARLLSHLLRNLIIQGAGRSVWKTVSIFVVLCGLCAAEVAAADTTL